MSPHAPGRLRLPPGEAGLRRLTPLAGRRPCDASTRLTPLAAGCVALGAWPYLMYGPARLALASFASAAPGT